MDQVLRFIQTRPAWHWLALGLLIVYVRGLFLDVMDVDASQYASISMEMLQDGSWLQVRHRHVDYLDKPPLLFWTSAFSFMLFGLHNWAYKLPSVLGALAGVYAVYRFSLLYYDRSTARQAAFILAASVGMLLMSNDVRTDTLLLGMTACTIWQLAAYMRQGRRWQNLLLAGVFAGLAMLAKGPIGLIVPAFAVGTHVLLQRDWRTLADWHWLVGLAVAAVVLAPMCWGLYQQFDLHPEKTVNGHTGVSGLYFYFWEQSFGRITGENVWKNDASGFYFLHVYLWAFLPWPLLLIGALWQRLSALFRNSFRLPETEEAFSIGAFVLSFLALSMSRYKLPHYIFVTLPWAAVLTARWLSLNTPSGRGWQRAQVAVYLLLAVASFLLLGYVFPDAPVWIWAVATGVFGSLAWIYFREGLPLTSDARVQRGVLAFLGTAFVLNFHFYPNLLPYQSTAAVARYVRAQDIPVDRLGCFNRHGHALDFYAGRVVDWYKTTDAVKKAVEGSGPVWLYTNEKGRAKLDSAGIVYQPVKTFRHFQVALLKPAFLNPDLRAETTDPVYLLKILEEQGQ
ncbi:MAG: glycosyltransferase family 39 protein [Bacteroidetes bacterium]|nr:MAG: glycosyltransferase family 39 protein [Bacteroidota bacterium]